MVANDIDGIYINFDDQTTMDLDDLFQSQAIKSVIYDIEDQEFYFLCNEKNGVIGFFLIKFNWDNPRKFVFITMWRHNLNVGDANMYISRGTNDMGPYKELICGFKTISINTYSTMVIDLSTDPSEGR